MGNGIASIEVKRSRGHLVVQANGQGPRGQKYIKGTVPLTATTPADKNFKTELAQAVTKLDPD